MGSNLSHYIDLYLQNYVVKLNNHLKNSDHLIWELLDLSWDKELGFLTMDVTSLFIKYETRVNCVKKFLDEDPEVPEPQKIFLLDAIRFILENIFFSYANLFMRGVWGGTYLGR